MPSYYRNAAKTAEAMKTDENGVVWMYTGDQCLIDNEGYCVVTGRIKDVIIRGKLITSVGDCNRVRLTNARRRKHVSR